jgi:hypothetical protein
MEYDEKTLPGFCLVPLVFCGELYLINHMVIKSKVLKNFQIILIEPKCNHKSLCHNIKFDSFW